MWLVNWIQQNKDFILAISALMSPFAAVFVALKVAKRQAASVIESTRMQVRSAALRDARQRSWEKLRDEFAAQIYEIIALNDAIDMSPTDIEALWLKVSAIEARKVRIKLVVSPKSQREYDKWATQEDSVFGHLLTKIKEVRDGKFTGSPENALSEAIDTLPGLAIDVLATEEKRTLDLD